jgi:hypothetical protein
VNKTTHFVALWMSIHRDLYRVHYGSVLRNRSEILLERYSLEECKRYVLRCRPAVGKYFVKMQFRLALLVI